MDASRIGQKISNGIWKGTISLCFLGTFYVLGIAGHMSYTAIREGMARKERLKQLKESGQLEDINAAAELINPNLKMVRIDRLSVLFDLFSHLDSDALGRRW
jgi:hypothetical protein